VISNTQTVICIRGKSANKLRQASSGRNQKTIAAVLIALTAHAQVAAYKNKITITLTGGGLTSKEAVRVHDSGSESQHANSR